MACNEGSDLVKYNIANASICLDQSKVFKVRYSMKTALRSLGFSLLFLGCFFCSINLAQQPAGKTGGGGVDFQRAVRPILSDNCFQCHGPDKNTRMVDLRLDTKEGAYEVRDSGR